MRSKTKAAFNILGLSGKAMVLATFTMLAPLAEEADAPLSQKFNTRAAPNQKSAQLRLELAKANGTVTNTADPNKMRRLLDSVSKKQPTEQERLEQELQQLTENDPIPYELMARLAHSESGFDTDAVSSEGARGILQFMPRTQLEQLYLHKDKLPQPYAKLAENVERYISDDVTKYRVKKGVDPEKIYAMAEEPTVAFILGREYVRSIAKTLKAKLPNYSLTYTDIKAAFVFGPTGVLPLIKAYADPKKRNHRALDYISQRAVAGNPNLFYANPNARKSPRSIKWLYEHFEKKMGTDPVPDDLDPPAETQQIAISSETMLSPPGNLN